MAERFDPNERAIEAEVDVDLCITAVTPEWTRVFGYSLDEVKGMKHRLLRLGLQQHPEMVTQLTMPVVREGKSGVEYDIDLRTRAGEVGWWHITLIGNGGHGATVRYRRLVGAPQREISDALHRSEPPDHAADPGRGQSNRAAAQRQYQLSLLGAVDSTILELMASELERVNARQDEIEQWLSSLSPVPAKRKVASGEERRTRSDKQLADQQHFMREVNEIHAEYKRAPRDRKTGRNPFQHFLLEKLRERGEGDVQWYTVRRRLTDYHLDLQNLPWSLALAGMMTYALLDEFSDGKLNEVVHFCMRLLSGGGLSQQF